MGRLACVWLSLGFGSKDPGQSPTKETNAVSLQNYMVEPLQPQCGFMVLGELVLCDTALDDLPSLRGQ